MKNLDIEALLLSWYKPSYSIWHKLLALSLYAFLSGFVWGLIYISCLLQSVR